MMQQSNTQLYRSQVETAFRRGGHHWSSEAEIADELSAIKESTDNFVEQGDYTRVIAAWEAIVSGIVDHFDEYEHELGTLYSVVDDCIEELKGYLADLQGDSVLREQILRILFAIFSHDVNAGSVEFGEEAQNVLVKQATAEERQSIINRVYDIIKRKQLQRDSCYEIQRFKDFLLVLETGLGDDD